MLAHHQAFDPAQRGYHILYRPGALNPCPGCGRSQWLVGRSTAECAFCATALPILMRPDDSGWAIHVA